MKRMLVLILLLATGASGWWWTKDHAAGADAQPAYEPADLVRTTLVVAIESTGVVEPRNRLEIKPSIAGRIEDVLVVEGQAVKRGDIMAWLSSTERATLLDAARTKGEATAQKWEEIYRATPLMAPLDGTVIARDTEPGQTVTAADTVLVISDRLIVRAQVDETDIGRIRTGLTARVRLDAYADVSMNGLVRHIAYEATTVNNVTIYEVEVEPEHIPEFMKNGMTATVAFQLETSGETWALPVDSIRVRDGMAEVFIGSDREGEPPVARGVSTGMTAQGWGAITDGLQGDERIIKSTFRLPEEKKMSGSPFIPKRPPGGPPRGGPP